MLCNLKKPAKSIIRSHVTWMETLNKYLGLLPTIKNSPQAVASTELGNVPFNETMLASIVLSHLPAAWRTQYALTHALVPESPRAVLGDLENIEKLFAELSWKCRFFRCRPQLVLKTYLRVFPTRRPHTADVSATSCDVGFFFSVSYVVSLPNCRHVVDRLRYIR